MYMSTSASQNNNDNIPVIRERKDVIIMNETLECACGRLKNRAHCPACGSVRLYGMAETKMALLPNNDVVKDCKTYRCVACAEKFNDVDWYFNCHASKKIDWVATKAKAREYQAKELLNNWWIRCEHGERFSYNDRTKCKAETGMFPEEIRDLQKAQALRKAKLTPEQRQRIEAQAEKIRMGSAGIIKEPDTEPTALEVHIMNCNYCNTHDDNCEIAKKLEEQS